MGCCVCSILSPQQTGTAWGSRWGSRTNQSSFHELLFTPLQIPEKSNTVYGTRTANSNKQHKKTNTDLLICRLNDFQIVSFVLHQAVWMCFIHYAPHYFLSVVNVWKVPKLYVCVVGHLSLLVWNMATRIQSCGHCLGLELFLTPSSIGLLF